MPSNKADTLTNDLPAIQVMPMKYRDLLSYIQISMLRPETAPNAVRAPSWARRRPLTLGN